jgi:splicing factor 3B subunit 3
VQVYPAGIYHVRADGRASEWRPPRGKPIVQASANNRQVAVGLQGGEVVYFELDETGTLAELDKKDPRPSRRRVPRGASRVSSRVPL